MNTFLAIAGAMGGVAVFATAVWTIVKSIGRQISAVKSNETATLANTEALGKLSGKIDQMDGIVNQHGERIARLEGTRL